MPFIIKEKRGDTNMFVSFDPYRTLGLPSVTYIKPQQMFQHIDVIRQAEAVLFPEYWQVNTLVYGLKKKIFPSIETYHIGHDKVEMTRMFQALFPEHMPYTEIKANTSVEREAVLETFYFPFVGKIPRSSMGNGVFYIEDLHTFSEYTGQTDVLYIQEYLPISRDLRVVWIGDRIVDAYWRESEGAFLNNLSKGGIASKGDIPIAALQLVERVATALNINHAGFDVAMVDNQPYLFEFNRLFGHSGVDPGIVKEAIKKAL